MRRYGSGACRLRRETGAGFQLIQFLVQLQQLIVQLQQLDFQQFFQLDILFQFELQQLFQRRR